jgi:hypothetical protein
MSSKERVRHFAVPAFSLSAVGYDRAMKRTILITMALLLAACGESDTDPGPGGVTVGEAKALDEAAEMIEARQLPDEALKPSTPAAGASPAAVPSSAAAE